MQKTHRLITKAREDAVLERWQMEHRVVQKLDSLGFAGDEDVAWLGLDEMEDEVRMEDLRYVPVAHTSNGYIFQPESRYDQSRPKRSAPVDCPSYVDEWEYLDDCVLLEWDAE